MVQDTGPAIVTMADQ